MRRQLMLVVALVGGCSTADDTTSDPELATTGSSTAELPEATSGPPPRADLGVAPPASCASHCAVSSECLGVGETDCLLDCTTRLDEREDRGEGCVTAFEASLDCTAALSCTELADYRAELPMAPCRAEADAAALACTLGDDTPPPACASFCETTQDCTETTASECLVSCIDARTANLDSGPGCVRAQDELLDCVAGLTCDAVAAWLDGAPDNLCGDEDEVLARACTGDDS